MTEWQTLIARYADGRPICNCRQAYYSLTGRAIMSGSGEVINNYPECRYGCESNQLFARDDIAKRVLAELPQGNPE